MRQVGRGSQVHTLAWLSCHALAKCFLKKKDIYRITSDLLEVHSDRLSHPCPGQILQSHGNGTSAAISCGLLAQRDRSPSSDQTFTDSLH